MDTAPTPDLPFVSATRIASCMGSGDGPVLIDVRRLPAFEAAPRMIAGALRIAPDELPAQLATLPGGRRLVAYCVRGHEVSRNAARVLLDAGHDAAYLEGGIDALLAECGLDDACLGNLAVIVRGADTGKPDLTPQSAGLLAISLGLSVNFTDDHAMLEQGMVVYDALYAWLRSARPEAHNAALFANS